MQGEGDWDTLAPRLAQPMFEAAAAFRVSDSDDRCGDRLVLTTCERVSRTQRPNDTPRSACGRLRRRWRLANRAGISMGRHLERQRAASSWSGGGRWTRRAPVAL